MEGFPAPQLHESSPVKVKSIYSNHNTPWHIKKRGAAEYIWYDILDKDGNYVMSTDRVRFTDGSKILNHALKVVCAVNKTSVVSVDGQFLEIKWV